MKASFISSLKNKASLKHVAVLSSGSLIAQLLTFACSPILTRLYTTEVVGVFTFVLSIVSMFSGVICLRYDVSIVTSGKRSFGPLLKACAIVTVLLSLVVSIGSFLFVYFTQALDRSHLWAVLFVFPLLVIAGLINVLNGCNNKDEQYKAISKAYIGRSAIQNMVMVFGGFIAPTALTLLFSQLFGQFAGLKTQLKGVGEKWKSGLVADWQEVKLIMIENKAQALFSTPATLLNAASYSLVSLCVGNVYGMAILGLYSVSFRVLGAPLSVFSSNIAKVHCKQAESEMAECSSYLKSTLKMVGIALVIILPIGLVLLLFSPQAFAFLFGSEWREAGVYVQILIPMFCLRFIAGSVGFGFYLSKKQWQEMIIQALLLVTLFGVVIVSNSLSGDVTFFLTSLSVTWSVVYAIEIALFLANAKKGCQ